MGIPQAKKVKSQPRMPVAERQVEDRDEKLLFSFSSIQRDEYFNLDGTCQNWAADLFRSLQQASEIRISDVYAKKYSGKTSPFRIHPHKGINNPCSIPSGVDIDDMWQIRISKSKGGIHGVFVENVFYVIWFDPQHNLYPDKNHGGLRKVIPPSTCCKDRDAEIQRLKDERDKAIEEAETWRQLAEERELSER